MNWKLIFSLSLFGLAMGLATISLVPTMVEPFLWLAIFLICAYIIAKRAAGKFFLHGFLVSIVNCFWITSAHVIFHLTYLANHAQEARMGVQMGVGSRTAMIIVGPIIGIISGLILGLFAYVASRLVKPAMARQL